ncbi:MAG TPA: acetyl-CoA carboxylase biotin carboxylase subunit [Pyrinomonadaceae bacterium]|jgi:acetyl-CoA carboxylase biotin carboxylase subunit|nr:acetyl-CoA carboxylase biotin carboxylase subunit [Pyrinomonadaceae bacterium]
MFRKILIANRGEIAVRIIRACRDLNISPVAIFSEADAGALHVRLADEAYCVGPASSSESYLNISAVIEAAQKSGAEAIHPGYGFLAENADFAEAVADANLVFIGPSSDAMKVMGSKTSARRAAIAAGAPVVPGTTEALKNFDDARQTSAQIGYPVMLKAAAGGGGKGMREVASESELRSAFDAAQSEALSAFGNSDVYVEKVVEKPRHIEIQIFADGEGNYVHLGERECSIQRRHQKVIEECPSPINDAELRERMGEAAIKIAKSVRYVGAGTVEFLYSDVTREFYFLEMNTRLQVEHPVTELVTGFDLVREQIGIAAGKPLSFKQADVHWLGHAIECRVYAEDPDNNFLPSPGKILSLRVPAGAGIRDDGGITEGDEVSIYYDPMISKLAAWGRTRGEAIDRMRRALDEYAVSGIKTTLPFFRKVIRDREFTEAKLDTGFIARFNERRVHHRPDNDTIAQRDIATLAAALAYQRAMAKSQPGARGEAHSKWRMSGRNSAVNSPALKRNPC